VLQQRVGRLIGDGLARQRAPTRRRRWRITVDDARQVDAPKWRQPAEGTVMAEAIVRVERGF
jgi:hypothetical protein